MKRVLTYHKRFIVWGLLIVLGTHFVKGVLGIGPRPSLTPDPEKLFRLLVWLGIFIIGIGFGRWSLSKRIKEVEEENLEQE